MTLPAYDVDYLGAWAAGHRLAADANMTCVILPGFALPPGYDRAQSDLLLRLNAGYPDIPPDMWWFDPAIRLVTGQPIQAADLVENYFGRPWQRWSRHLAAGQWRSGVDSLETFVALIRRELIRCAAQR